MTPGFWLVPSMCRPQELQRLMDSYRFTDATSPVHLLLWEQDEHRVAYTKLEYPEGWKVFYSSTPFMAGSAMKWAFERWPEAQFYGFLADDIVLRTRGWDKKLAESAGHYTIAYPDDTIANVRLCTHPVVGGDLLRALGWWALPGINHNFVDSALMAVGIALDCLCYRSDVVFEHLHWIVKKSELDPIYKRGNDRFQGDCATFFKWARRGGLMEDLKRVDATLEANRNA